MTASERHLSADVPRADLHRKALVAAASVVLAMGLGACAPLGDPDDTSSAGGDTTDTAAETAAVDTGPDCNAVPAAEAGACCSDRDTWCQEQYPDDLNAARDCYYGPEWDGSTGCSPWGPPAPPRFTGAAVA